ncbi:MAG: serine/threonine-protein kinase [Planctomycetota bacterium]
MNDSRQDPPPALKRLWSDGLDGDGRYRIETVIGRGGMGWVIAATDQTLAREVAIKFIKPELAGDDASRERFLHEARTVAALDHPQIVPVFEVGNWNGLAYLIMPRLVGHSLAEWLQRGFPFSPSQVQKMGCQMAAGLAAAHAAGIIHRDIKPANLFLESSRGNLRILDFGLAQSERWDGESVLVGTPGYLSPEQARDEVIDHRTDLYSWGVVMYQLLAGRLPIECGSSAESKSQSDAESLVRLLTTKPEPIASVCPRTPDTLAQCIDACLQHDRRRRPENAQILVDRLMAEKSEPIQIPGQIKMPAEIVIDVPKSTRAKPPKRRLNRGWILIATGIAALLATGACLWRWNRPDRVAAGPAAKRSAAVAAPAAATVGKSPPGSFPAAQRSSGQMATRSKRNLLPKNERLKVQRPSSNIPESLQSDCVVRISDGRGQDTYIAEGQNDDWGRALEAWVSYRRDSEKIPRRMTYLKFDLEGLQQRNTDVIDAYLLLTIRKPYWGDVPPFRWKAWLLRDDSAGADWLASGPERILWSRKPDRIPNLDRDPAGNPNGRSSVWHEDQEWVMIQHRANGFLRAIQDDTDGLLTIILEPGETPGPPMSIVTSEASVDYGPALVIRLKESASPNSK